jgi:hypothetical protein
MRHTFDATRKILILRKPTLRDAACGGSSGQGGYLEGRTALIQPNFNSPTGSFREKTNRPGDKRFPEHRV